MFTRTLGRSNIEVSAMGLGCWAIGGLMWRDGKPTGWGEVNDDESLAALRRGIDMGITFLDTADVYGVGHSERLVAQAIKGKRHQLMIATKFGHVFDATTRTQITTSGDPEYVRKACEASLDRLETDYVDLYQFHAGQYEPARAGAVVEALEELVRAGKIRCYAWSTDNVEGARVFAQGKHCAAVQHRLNILDDAPAMLALCAEYNLASINRNPLGMGLLTGKINTASQFPPDDVRANPEFTARVTGEKRLKQLEAIREVLTQGGRTLAQGALGWLWARSPHTIPIPGFKTVAQVEENVRALEFGALSETQMREIDRLLKEVG
jgi:aryl-alcohol dehydrogenase-like predicted oxidoreductase